MVSGFVLTLTAFTRLADHGELCLDLSHDRLLILPVVSASLISVAFIELDG